MRFGRRKPLHEKLAEAGGVLFNAQEGGFLAHPPDLFGQPSPLGEPALHGVPRAREWDAVASAEVQSLRVDAVHFVALPDGTLVVDEDIPDGSLAPLADAVENTISPPYRAEAIRRRDDVWAVGARRIEVVELPGLAGEELELVIRGDERTLVVDGGRAFGRVPALERLVDGDSVIRAQRIDGQLWEVRADPL